MLAACPMFGHFRGDVDLARVLCVGGTTKGVIWAGWTLPGLEKEGKVKASVNWVELLLSLYLDSNQVF